MYRSGGRPWYKSSDDYDDVFLVAGPEEWCKIMDAFSYFCFNIAGFEIFRTAEMGLGCIMNFAFICFVFVTLFSLMYVGIHATRRNSLALLSTKLAGFLEYVPRAHFRELQRLHYKYHWLFATLAMMLLTFRFYNLNLFRSGAVHVYPGTSRSYVQKSGDAYNFFCFNIAGFEIVRTSYCVDGILV